MNKQTKALKMAIEAMRNITNEFMPDNSWVGTDIFQQTEKAYKACKEALEQSAQEPVAEYIWVNPSTQEQYLMTKITDTHPAPSWQGLSDDEIGNLFDAVIAMDNENNEFCAINFGRAIEQALKEKNGG